jgi:hypothetical protein
MERLAVNVAGSNDVIRTFAPATGDALAELPVTSPEDVRRTVARARTS